MSNDHTSEAEFPGVETWLRERSRRPAAALDLWRKLLASADRDTGEIPLTRDELATAVGVAPRTVSEIMTELEGITAITRHSHGRRVRYAVHPSRRGGSAAGTEGGGTAPEAEPGGEDGEPLVDPGAQDAQAKHPGEAERLNSEPPNARAVQTDEGLHRFADWAAQQIFILEKAWRAAEEGRKASIAAATAAAVRARRIHLVLVLLAIGLGAGWWWADRSTQAEIDAARMETENAIETVGEQARRIEELEVATKAASPNRPKAAAGETPLEKALDSFLAAHERQDYAERIAAAEARATHYFRRLADACTFTMSAAQRGKASECADMPTPAEPGYWRRR